MATAPPRCRCRSTCRRPAGCSRERRSAATWSCSAGRAIPRRPGSSASWACPATVKQEGMAEAEDDNGNVEHAYRYTETLPNGVSHAILKMRDNGRLDNTAEVTVPAGRLF